MLNVIVMMKKKNGQVWVETVIYTLIGLAVIGMLLLASKPKIEEMKDKLVIEQTIKSISTISDKIYEVQMAPGNRRVIDLKISKGKFYINSTANEIGWRIESNYKYSQLDSVVDLGNMKVLTTEGAPYLVKISSAYTINLTLGGKEIFDEVEASPAPYKMTIESRGIASGQNLINVDITLS